MKFGESNGLFSILQEGEEAREMCLRVNALNAITISTEKRDTGAPVTKVTMNVSNVNYVIMEHEPEKVEDLRRLYAELKAVMV